VYILFALAAVWCFSLFFRRNEIVETDRRHHGHLDTGHGGRFE
jgi:uncharacterized membrane protein YuzA (DUF378 family)